MSDDRAARFREAFAQARKAGLKEFVFDGKPYTTQLAEEVSVPQAATPNTHRPPTIDSETARRYKAIQYAETGGEANPWIRTKVIPPEGSSAFGPAQITKTLLDDKWYFNRLSPDTQQFVQTVMLPMQELMIKYGGKDMKPGFEEYDYGKSGNFPAEMKPMYDKLAQELLSLKAQRYGNDTNAILTSWRGKTSEQDPAYRERFKEGYARQRVLNDVSNSVGQQSEALLR